MGENNPFNNKLVYILLTIFEGSIVLFLNIRSGIIYY
jgi:hypothetical protein